MIIKNRRQMAQLLEDRMNKSYRELAAGRKLTLESSLVKTYLLEAHRLEGAHHENVFKTLKKSWIAAVLGTSKKPLISETAEEFFFNVDFDYAGEEVKLFLDATDPRFWLVHSTARSTSLDHVLLDRLVSFSHDIDSVWLPGQLLENVAGVGTLRGLGLDYDRRKIPDIDFEQADAPVEYLKMQLWGTGANRVLEILRDRAAFPGSTTLSKVKVKFSLETDRATQFAIDDIRYDGKITARGTSFQSHLSLVGKAYSDYKNSIRTFEEKNGIYWEASDGHLDFRGSPLNITFPEPIPDVVRFCEPVFSATAPFRMWGAPVKTSSTSVRVAAVDLHVGKRINLEIARDYMRVYLPKSGCGNSIARLFTNLQHYYNSLVDIRTGDGDFAFQFLS